MGFFITLVVTALTVMAYHRLVADRLSFSDWEQRIAQFVGNRFAEVWDDPGARNALVDEMNRTFPFEVSLRDAAGQALTPVRPPCEHHEHQHVVRRDGVTLGEITVCVGPPPGRPPGAGLGAMLVALLAVVFATGFLARRLARPIYQVADVADRIGGGDLDARVHLRGNHGEVGLMAESVNDMAERIQRELGRQKELLAMVSHEMRTPLGHLRLLIEMARDGNEAAQAKAHDEMERELVHMDQLVGALLSQSRLAFDVVQKQPVELPDLLRRELERHGASGEVLHVEGAVRSVSVDPTLLGHAVGNLVRNAESHGGGLTRLVLTFDDDGVEVAAYDRGPGIDPRIREKMFEAFEKVGQGKGLGLGLNLVARVAEAHGGEVFADDTEDGTRVGFTLRA